MSETVSGIVRFLGVDHNEHDVEEVKQELTEFTTDETSALFVETPSNPGSVTCGEFLQACLRNPLFMGIKLVMILVNAIRVRMQSGNRSTTERSVAEDLETAYSEIQAAREFKRENGFDYYRVDMDRVKMVNTQSLRWTVESWIGVLLLLTILVGLGRWSYWPLIVRFSQDPAVGAGYPVALLVLSGLLMWLLLKVIYRYFINRYANSTVPRRNKCILANIQGHCEADGHADVCMITGAGHLDNFEEITEDEIGAIPEIRDMTEPH